MQGFFGREPQAHQSAVPRGQPGVVYTPPQGSIWGSIKAFLAENYAAVKQVPFRMMTVDAFTLVIGVDTWIDQNSKLSKRRAFAVTNNDPTLGNDIWIKDRGMTAAGQGGFILAQGGVAYVPGGEEIDVHLWATAAGTVVSFWQWA